MFFSRFNQVAAKEQAIATAMAELFPHGLGMLKWSYEAEAGWAERFAQLTEQYRELLAGLKLDNTTVLELARQTIEAGRQLGQLLANRPAQPERDTATELTLCNAWIRAANCCITSSMNCRPISKPKPCKISTHSSKSASALAKQTERLTAAPRHRLVRQL
jgi:hypothetical protein